MSTQHTAAPPDLQAAARRRLDELGLPLGDEPSARLVDDLGWDSLSLFELLALFDELGVDAPDDLVAGLRTVGDVMHYLGVLEPRRRAAGPAHRVALTPVTAADTAYLHRLHLEGDALTRYRLRGTTPAPEQLQRVLWEDVLAQFIVRDRAGTPLGLVSCIGADLRNRHAHIAVLADPASRGTGLMAAGAWSFAGYLFSQFDLRKLYAEALESNFEQFRSGAGHRFEVEGRLTEHEYVDGRFEDLVIVSLTRERWQHEQRRLLGEPAAS